MVVVIKFQMLKEAGRKAGKVFSSQKLRESAVNSTTRVPDPARGPGAERFGMEVTMEKHLNSDKMIFAILQGEDYHVAIEELNKEGFYATILHSSGGFLRRKSVTLMIGVNHVYLNDALNILKHYGERSEIQYQPPYFSRGMMGSGGPNIQVPVWCGGVTLFVVNVEQNERY